MNDDDVEDHDFWSIWHWAVSEEDLTFWSPASANWHHYTRAQYRLLSRNTFTITKVDDEAFQRFWFCSLVDHYQRDGKEIGLADEKSEGLAL